MRAAKRSMFTLVELMIVVIIVAILAAASVPIYSSLVGRAYETEIVSALGSVRTANRVFRAENGEYATSISELTGEDSDGGGSVYITDGDFDDMAYISNAPLEGDGDDNPAQITLSGTADAPKYTWTGQIDGYDYEVVEMGEDGKITSRDEEASE